MYLKGKVNSTGLFLYIWSPSEAKYIQRVVSEVNEPTGYN